MQTSTDLKAHVLRWNELNIQIDVHSRRGRALLEGLWSAKARKSQREFGKSQQTLLSETQAHHHPKKREKTFERIAEELWENGGTPYLVR